MELLLNSVRDFRCRLPRRLDPRGFKQHVEQMYWQSKRCLQVSLHWPDLEKVTPGLWCCPAFGA